MAGRAEFCVQVAGGEARAARIASGPCSYGELAGKVRAVHGIAEDKHLRLICAGRELWDGELLSPDLHPVIHCVVTDALPASRQGGRAPSRPSVDSPSVDWVDLLDPGKVLLWTFGAVLTTFWILYALAAEAFDRASLIMLCTMTSVFVVPYLASHVPWPAQRLWATLCSLERDPWIYMPPLPQRETRRTGIPPRPRAPLHPR